jgi:hypothetical protein
MLIGRSAMRLYWHRRFRRIHVIGQIRERFATDRSEAVRLLHEGRIAPDSETFAMLYRLSSTLVRRSQNYPTYSRGYLRAVTRTGFTANSANMSRLHKEMQESDVGVKRVWIKFVQDIHFMIEHTVLPIRVLMWFENKFGVVTPLLVWLGKIVEKQLEKRNGASTLITAMDVMRTGNVAAGWGRREAA